MVGSNGNVHQLSGNNSHHSLSAPGGGVSTKAKNALHLKQTRTGWGKNNKPTENSAHHLGTTNRRELFVWQPTTAHALIIKTNGAFTPNRWE